jgi:hypothetical protein
VLTPRTHTLPSRAHSPKGTHCISTGLCRTGSEAGVSRPWLGKSWDHTPPGSHGPTHCSAQLRPRAGLSGVCRRGHAVRTRWHMCAHQNHTQAVLRPRIQRGKHSAQCLPRTGLQSGTARIGLGRGLHHHADQKLPTPRPTHPPLTTGSSAGHLDLPAEGTGHGLQLTYAAIRDTIAATHGIIDTRAHLLAFACSLAILHSTRCPECTLHPTARGWGLVWGRCGPQRRCSPSCGQSPSPTQQPLSGVGMVEKEPDAQDTAEKGTDTQQRQMGTQESPDCPQ